MKKGSLATNPSTYLESAKAIEFVQGSGEVLCCTTLLMNGIVLVMGKLVIGLEWILNLLRHRVSNWFQEVLERQDLCMSYLQIHY